MKMKSVLTFVLFMTSVASEDLFAQTPPQTPAVPATGEEYARRVNARDFRGCDRLPGGSVLNGTDNSGEGAVPAGRASRNLRGGKR